MAGFTLENTIDVSDDLFLEALPDPDDDKGGPVLRLHSRSQETDGAVPIVITVEEVEPLRAALEEAMEILADWAAF